MKMSYKIALAVSVAVCVLALIMFAGPSSPDESSTQAVTADQPEVEPRKSLRSESAQAQRTTPSTSTSNLDKPESSSSLAQDLRNRMQAIDEQPTQAPDPVTVEDTSTESETPEVIALARTDADTQAETIKPEPEAAPAISREDLDNILGYTSTPAVASLTEPADKTSTADGNTEAGAGSTTAFVGGTYTIQPGDTFSAIAVKHYGDETKWFDIAQANPTVDPTRLRVGQELKLPSTHDLRVSEEPVPAGPEAVRSYTIRPGDSLSTVAERFYDDPTLWRVIYNYNRQKIGSNPNAIQAGMTLKVPPRVNGAR